MKNHFLKSFMILFFLILFILPELKGQTKNLLELKYYVKQTAIFNNNINKYYPPEFSDEQKELIKTYTIIGAVAGFITGTTLGIIRINRDSGNSKPSLESAASILLPAVYGAIGLITGGAAGWLIGNFAAYNSK